MRTVSNVVNGFVHVSDSTRPGCCRSSRNSTTGRASSRAASRRTLRPDRAGAARARHPYFAELTAPSSRRGAARLTSSSTRPTATVNASSTSSTAPTRAALLTRSSSARSASPRRRRRCRLGRPLVFLGETAFPRFDHVTSTTGRRRGAVAHLALSGRRGIAAIGARRRRTLGQPAARRILRRTAKLRDPQDHSLVERVSSFRRASGAQAMAQASGAARPARRCVLLSRPVALGSLSHASDPRSAVRRMLPVVGFDECRDGQFSVPSLRLSPRQRFIAATALASLSAKLNGNATKKARRPSRHTCCGSAESSGMRY